MCIGTCTEEPAGLVVVPWYYTIQPNTWCAAGILWFKGGRTVSWKWFFLWHTKALSTGEYLVNQKCRKNISEDISELLGKEVKGILTHCYQTTCVYNRSHVRKAFVHVDFELERACKSNMVKLLNTETCFWLCITWGRWDPTKRRLKFRFWLHRISGKKKWREPCYNVRGTQLPGCWGKGSWVYIFNPYQT